MIKDGKLFVKEGLVVNPQPGIYTGITQEEYRNGVGMSNSSLGLLMKSGRAMWWDEQKRILKLQDEDEENAALASPEARKSSLIFGSAMHKMVLEPETWDEEFVVVPDDAPRKPTVAQRNAAKPSSSTLDAIAYWDAFEKANTGKDIVTKKELDKMFAMHAVLQSHSFEIDGYRIPTLNLFKNGHAETSMYWQDEDTGVLCKGRPDYLSDGFMADYKTAMDGSMYGFQKSMADFGYYRQAPFYLDGMRVASGGEMNHNRFVFVVQEKKEPFEVFVYAIGQTSMDIGREDYKKLLTRYVENEENYGPLKGNVPWPMACGTIMDVELPQWAMYQGGLVK